MPIQWGFSVWFLLLHLSEPNNRVHKETPRMHARGVLYLETLGGWRAPRSRGLDWMWMLLGSWSSCVRHESFCGLGLLFITINLGSPYPKKHLRRAQSPRRDIDIRTRLHSWNFTIFRFCEGSFAFSARIFFLHHCCPHLLLLFPTLPRQWRFCHGCFSALRVSIYFIFSPPQSTVFFFVRNCGEALQPRRTQVLLQLLRASVSRKTKTKKNNFGISVNKHVVGPKTLSHARLSHYFNQTHLPAPRPTLNK